MNAYTGIAEALINTHDTFLEQPEHLQSPADLGVFLRRYEIVPGTPASEEDLAAARSLRDALRAIWTAESVELAADRVNALLASVRAQPRVEVRDGGVLRQVLAGQNNAPLVERLTIVAVADTLEVLQTAGHFRMRACAAAPCRDVFVDTSRNGTRRFCSDRCANRWNVAAYRERQRGGGP